jgi:hypothetical protein
VSLIIETGAGRADAESFASAAELADYATKFGKVVPTDEPGQEALLRRAALQMNSLQWKGCAINRDQALAWPRFGVCRNGFDLPSNAIPAQVKAGQMALAAEIHADDLADPATKQGAITEETVGPITTKFAAASAVITKAAAIRQSYAQFTGLVELSSQVKLSRG